MGGHGFLLGIGELPFSTTCPSLGSRKEQNQPGTDGDDAVISRNLRVPLQFRNRRQYCSRRRRIRLEWTTRPGIARP
ncbi:hypothetical protein NXC24_PC01184 (plasmid) [Rhizobium sp. NXC24]|nr:hypothetical protein NXC24_PC01184 [Rhizobium sp. NXC24]